VTPGLMADGRNQRVWGDNPQASWGNQLLAASTTGKAWVRAANFGASWLKVQSKPLSNQALV
jgi:hypothetical protein